MSALARKTGVTQIAIAVVRHNGMVLIGPRPEGAPLAGLWEFPGGKVEALEEPERAAARECLEETGIAIEVYGTFPVVMHDYEHGRVQLHFFDCRPVEPLLAAKPPYRWVAAANLSRYEFPAANAAIVRLLVADAATDDL
jgi:mutator protein MutT